MTLQTEKQIITIHKLLNISRSTGNQTVKFGQLIEYKMRNIYLKSNTKCGGEANPRLSPKEIKIESISGSTFWHVIEFDFICMSQPSSTKIYKRRAHHMLLRHIMLS